MCAAVAMVLTVAGLPVSDSDDPANPRTELAPSATLRVIKVDDTTAIEAARFVKPAAAPR